MKRKLFSVLALAAVAFLSSCGGDDETPKNVINSADGVTVALTWTTGGTSAEALEDADLDLYLYGSASSTVSVESSTSGSQFEDFVVSDVDFEDDTYTVKVLLYENVGEVEIDFTATVSAGDKEIETTGTFATSVTDGTYEAVFTIKKVGNKYTVNKI